MQRHGGLRSSNVSMARRCAEEDAVAAGVKAAGRIPNLSSVIAVINQDILHDSAHRTDSNHFQTHSNNLRIRETGTASNSGGCSGAGSAMSANPVSH
jgi:hypothetical protein